MAKSSRIKYDMYNFMVHNVSFYHFFVLLNFMYSYFLHYAVSLPQFPLTQFLAYVFASGELLVLIETIENLHLHDLYKETKMRVMRGVGYTF